MSKRNQRKPKPKASSERMGDFGQTIIENVTLHLGHDWKQWFMGTENNSSKKKLPFPVTQPSCDEQVLSCFLEKLGLAIFF
jgi:hypothetical protein